MTSPIDVLGMGCVAVDELLFVDEYPAEDTKAPVRRRERQCGGLTATALVAAARMGGRCAYAGTLGADPASHFVAGRLSEEGIDLRYLRLQRDVRPIQSTILVAASGTRTVLYDLSGAQGARIDWPPAEAIQNARVLFVDHFGVEGMTRAARLARKAGVSVVADFECDPGNGFADLLNLVDHLVVSEHFACQLTGVADPAAAACALWTSQRAAVVVTAGQRGGWFVSDNSPTTPQHYPAFAVDAVDTTGCGDVFHGAYTAALAEGRDLADRIRLASAAAALKVTRPGGQAGIPRREAVELFLQEQSAR